jgi:hypothetical protein
LVSHDPNALTQSELANYRAYTTLRANADKKALKQSEKLQLDIKILGQLAKLVHTAPALFLHSKNDDREEKKLLFQGVCDIAVDVSSPYLVRKGTQCLVTLHDPEHIEQWSRTDALGAFWDLGAIFNHSIGNALLRRELTSPQILEFVSFLESVLAQRKTFLSNHFKVRCCRCCDTQFDTCHSLTPLGTRCTQQIVVFPLLVERGGQSADSPVQSRARHRVQVRHVLWSHVR